MIKKIIAWPLTHTLYFIGDIFSKLTDCTYSCCSKCMILSIWLNDWAGLKIWSKRKEEYEEL